MSLEQWKHEYQESEEKLRRYDFIKFLNTNINLVPFITIIFQLQEQQDQFQTKM